MKRCSKNMQQIYYRIIFPINTERKLNVTIRRRTGRPLNVLCTYNLRPVSTGMPKCDFNNVAKQLY